MSDTVPAGSPANLDTPQHAVSVVIPAYNAEAHLERCLTSVARQTVVRTPAGGHEPPASANAESERTARHRRPSQASSIEIVVVDDGSSDKSYEIASRFRTSNPHLNLRLIRQRNLGPSAARNTGVSAAQGDWICFVDADDTLDPSMIQVLVGAAERCGSDVAICALDRIRTTEPAPVTAEHAAQLISGASCRSGADTYGEMFLAAAPSLMVATAAVYRRELLCGGEPPFDENLKHTEDVLFRALLFAQAETVAVVHAALYHHWETATSLSGTYDPRLHAAVDRLARRLRELETSDSPAGAVALAQRSAVSGYLALYTVLTLAEEQRAPAAVRGPFAERMRTLADSSALLSHLEAAPSSVALPGYRLVRFAALRQRWGLLGLVLWVLNWARSLRRAVISLR